ncbi:Kappa-fimbriae usher protein [Vibrio astriarenae]|nr:Kappa-fimbriae usher protein [Vibrio sp. C7]
MTNNKLLYVLFLILQANLYITETHASDFDLSFVQGGNGDSEEWARILDNKNQSLTGDFLLDVYSNDKFVARHLITINSVQGDAICLEPEQLKSIGININWEYYNSLGGYNEDFDCYNLESDGYTLVDFDFISQRLELQLPQAAISPLVDENVIDFGDDAIKLDYLLSGFYTNSNVDYFLATDLFANIYTWNLYGYGVVDSQSYDIDFLYAKKRYRVYL